MEKNNNLFYAGMVFGAFYFPFAALYYALSRKCLMYSSNRLYRLLILLRHGDWYEERLRKTIGYLDIGSDTKVLEVGCGEGKFSRRLLEAGADLKAIDVNERFISKLQERGGGVFDLCSVTDMGYEDDSFDRVVMFDVLHHIPDYMDALSEIRRVLKPGGYAIVWEGSEPFGEEHLPPELAGVLMRILDGETNPVDLGAIKERFTLEELEPYCYVLSK